MCGFAGIIDPSGQTGKAESRAMALALAHRGPDDHGDWADATLPVAMSFRRLAILDLSPDGNQPMHDGPLTICFNGEIYNYKELRQRLEIDHGCVFKTTSDTEVLLKGVLQWGLERTLNEANGMYAIALLDRRDETLTLARDRFGEKPLYYSSHKGALYFASELKALRAQIDVSADKNSVSTYLQFGFVPAPDTIYENVKALQPGEFLTFNIRNPQNLERDYLFDLGAGLPQLKLNEDEALDLFEDALTRAIDIRLRSDVPLGVFLSGGLDSSLILAMASRLLDKPMPAFTIAMESDDPAYDETAQAKLVAEFYHAEHHILPLNERIMLDALPGQIAHMDQPLADAAILPTALLSHFARKHVTVALGGEGGDELQAGYTRHAQETRLKAIYALRGIAKPFLPLAKSNLPQWKRQSDKLERFIGTKAASSYEALMTLWPQGNRMDLPSGYREADAEFYLPHDLLMKLDGATMQASLEGRCPYLDPDLWRVMSLIPRRHWANKKLARDLLAKRGGVLATGKRGLTLPLAEWLRGDLRDWGEAQIADFKALGLLPDKTVDAEWDALLKGQSDHAQPIWALCLFSAWRNAHNLAI